MKLTSPTEAETARLGRLGRIVPVGMVVSSLRAFARYPSLLLALCVVWVGLAAVGWLALKPAVAPWLDAEKELPPWYEVAAVGWCAFAVAGVALSFGCLVVLERVRQIEMDEPRSLTFALRSASVNTVRALPLVLVWSILWLAVSAIGFVLGDDDEDGHRDAGDLLDGSIRLVTGAMRMLMFCSLPALAWEAGQSPLGAVKRGIAVARRHKAEFGVGLLLSDLAGAVATVPWSALALHASFTNHTPGGVVLVAIFVSLLLWTFVMLVQQLYAAELYVWHLVAEDAGARAVAAGEAPPAFDAVTRPSILDGVPALARLSF